MNETKFRKVKTKDNFTILVEEYNESLGGEQEIYLHDMYDNFIDYIVVDKEGYDEYVKSIESDALEDNVDAWGSGRYTLTNTAEEMLNDITEDMEEQSKGQIEEDLRKGEEFWAENNMVNVVEDNKNNKKFFYLGDY